MKFWWLELVNKTITPEITNLLFLSKSSMHLLICAIHSCFSVEVAAYTANDFEAVRISQPLRNSVQNNCVNNQSIFRYIQFLVLRLLRSLLMIVTVLFKDEC